MGDEDKDNQAQRNIEVESRLTKLEAILPTLATKADLAALGSELRTEIGDVRIDFHKLDASIKTWMMATVLTIIGTMLAALFGLNQINKNAAPAASAQPPVIINLPGNSAAPASAPR